MTCVVPELIWIELQILLAIIIILAILFMKTALGIKISRKK
jgi:hypothetical protein